MAESTPFSESQHDSTTSCQHRRVVCLNQHEPIRKYRCLACGAVMMCACDEASGRKFAAHKLNEGTELETRNRVQVTLGFQQGVCSECRGLPADSAPAGEIHGRTTKIKRYYWREIYFAEHWARAEWHEAHPQATDDEQRRAYKDIEQQVLADIKTPHATSPKYVFNELSQAEVIARYSVEVEALHAAYIKVGNKGSMLEQDGKTISPEVFATRHYEAIGWSVLALESVPLHALFGVMMWMLIQDPDDPKLSMVGFGARDIRREKSSIWTVLPSDFGTKGYGDRRAVAIEAHLDRLIPERDELLWIFDYWRSPSSDLRQYLWAHREADVDRARRLIEVLPPETIFAMLRYLANNYWGHFLGWPDLLLFRPSEFLFVEVKSSSDKLSEDQKRWIADNHDQLRLPFGIAKIHRGRG